ncbi:MAG: hypothetical protein ACRC2K_14265, partial [Clostridium sp.]
SQRLKVLMRSMCIKDKYPNECEYNLPYYKDDMIRDSIQITLKKNNNFSKEKLILKEMFIDNLKELCAISSLARKKEILNYKVDRFYIVALNKFTKSELVKEEIEDLIVRIEKLKCEVQESLKENKTINEIS